MAMSVTYASLGGEILSESRSGARKDYLPDPLGSTAALLDAIQSKTDTWVYWPYGEERIRTGTTPTPFQFVGTLGYFKDSLDRLYVRARTYRPGLARWQTTDPLWPRREAYAYGKNSPVRFTDKSGLGPGQVFQDCMANMSPAVSRRAACKYCKAYSGSGVNCDNSCFDTPDTACGKWYKGKWKIAKEGCIKACEMYMCAGLKFPFGPACKALCKSQCDDVTGGGKGPGWALCGNLEEHDCQDCCLEACGKSGLLCADQCGTSCC